MSLTIQTNVCRGRTDPKPAGKVICCECGRVLDIHIDRMRCCHDGCHKTLCVNCFDLLPVCFLCNRHMCIDHMTTMGDLEICQDCAGDKKIIEREVDRLVASLRANREAYVNKMSRLVDRLEAAAYLLGKAINHGA